MNSPSKSNSYTQEHYLNVCLEHIQDRVTIVNVLYWHRPSWNAIKRVNMRKRTNLKWWLCANYLRLALSANRSLPRPNNWRSIARSISRSARWPNPSSNDPPFKCKNRVRTSRICAPIVRPVSVRRAIESDMSARIRAKNPFNANSVINASTKRKRGRSMSWNIPDNDLMLANFVPWPSPKGVRFRVYLF